jgi:hypothetical protein
LGKRQASIYAQIALLLLQFVLKSNRAAIGTRVKIVATADDGSVREFHHVVSTGASYGANSLQLEVGLGNCTKISSVEVNNTLQI